MWKMNTATNNNNILYYGNLQDFNLSNCCPHTNIASIRMRRGQCHRANFVGKLCLKESWMNWALIMITIVIIFVCWNINRVAILVSRTWQHHLLVLMNTDNMYLCLNILQKHDYAAKFSTCRTHKHILLVCQNKREQMKYVCICIYSIQRSMIE